MERRAWQAIAVTQGLLGVAGLVAVATLGDGDGTLASWYAFGPGWLLLAAYSWRNKPGSPAEAPLLDNVVLLGGGILALVVGLLLGA